jgi:hypothetical protein
MFILNLKTGIVEIKYTKTEIEVNRLAKINPEIIKPSQDFDLLDGDDNAIINIELN